MNRRTRLAIPVLTLALLGSPAWAQETGTQAAAVQRAAELEAARKQLESTTQAQAAAQAAAAQNQKQADQDRRVAELEAAKLKDALKQAERARELALYDRGTAALDQARYQQALKAFAAAVALKGTRADGALYWKAFAEYKLAAMQAALQTLEHLETSFPDSRWMKEARALELEVRGASGAHVSPAATQDEELKLLALNGLLQTDPEQALPLLEKMINGQQSPQLKKRALFVLSQGKSPRAREILTSIAKSPSNPDLQLDALQYLQMFGGPEDKKALSDIYAGSKDWDVKARILEAYMAGGEFNRLLQVARNEADAPLRLQAIRMLSVMPSPKSAEALVGLYWIDGQSKEVRSEIVDALFVQANARALVDIARKETDPALRKRIVERLSMMKSKDATGYLMELVNK